MNSMKNSLSIYVQSSIEIDEEREALELSQYLDDIITKYNVYSRVDESLFDSLKNLSSSLSNGFLSSFMTSFGFAPSKYEQEMNKIFEENAKNADKRAKELEKTMEDARIAKLRAKNAAKQTMLDEKNNAKIRAINRQKEKLEAQKKYWEDRKKKGIAYNWTEQQIEQAQTAIEKIPLEPEAKDKGQQLVEAIRSCAYKESPEGSGKWVMRDPKEIEAEVKKVKDGPLGKEFADFCTKNSIDPDSEDAQSLYRPDGAFTQAVNDSIGLTIDVKNAQKDADAISEEIKKVNGDLSDDQKKEYGDWRKKKLEEQKKLLMVGDSGVDKDFLKTLTEDELKSMLPEGSKLEDFGFSKDKDGKISIDTDKLKDKVSSKEFKEEEATRRSAKELTAYDDAIRALEEVNSNRDATDEEREAAEKAVIKAAKKAGVTISSPIPSIDELKGSIKTEVSNGLNKKSIEAIDSEADKAATEPVGDCPVPKDQREAYENFNQNPPSAEDLRDLHRWEAERKRKRELAEQNTPEAIAERVNDTMNRQKAEQTSEKLFKLDVDGKSLKELTQPNNPGEQKDDKGTFIVVNGEKKYAPEPGTKEFDAWDLERKKVALGAAPENDKTDVIIRDGKAIIIDKDGKEGDPIDLSNASNEEKQAIVDAKKKANQRAANEAEKKEFLLNVKNNGIDKLSDEEKELFAATHLDDNELKEMGFSEDDIDELTKTQEKAEEWDEEVTDDEEGLDAEDDSEDNGEEENETDDTKRPTNPKKIWRRRKNKNTGKISKSYFYVGKDAERRNNNESISKKDYIEKVKHYKEKLARWKEAHSNEGGGGSTPTNDQNSLTTYIANLLEKQTSSCTALKSYLLDKLK